MTSAFARIAAILSACSLAVALGASEPPSNPARVGTDSGESAGDGALPTTLAAATCVGVPDTEHVRTAPSAENLDPRRNLEAAWRAVLEEYVGFDRSNAGDWEARRDAAMDRLDQGEGLFDVLTEMLGGLGSDRASFIHTTDGRMWSGGSIASQDSDGNRANPLAAIDDVYFGRSLGEEPGVHLGFARLADSTLYVRLTAPRATSISEREEARRGALATDARLIGMLADLAPGSPVVIDLRYAGWHALGDPLGVASHLADEPGVVMLSQARSPGQSDPLASEIQLPTVDGPHVTGPVVLLTGATTIGQAEVLALATMPNARVTRIGQATSGGLTRPRVVRLPNGWRIGVPGSLLLSWNSMSFQGTGIPPHTIAALPATGSGAVAGDPSLDAALAYLQRLRASGLLPAVERGDER